MRIGFTAEEDLFNEKSCDYWKEGVLFSRVVPWLIQGIFSWFLWEWQSRSFSIFRVIKFHCKELGNAGFIKRRRGGELFKRKDIDYQSERGGSGRESQEYLFLDQTKKRYLALMSDWFVMRRELFINLWICSSSMYEFILWWCEYSIFVFVLGKKKGWDMWLLSFTLCYYSTSLNARPLDVSLIWPDHVNSCVFCIYLLYIL